MTRRKALRRALAAAVLLLAGLAAGIPFVRVPWLAAPFRQAMESALGRSVEFAEVRLSLLPAPSVVAYQVVIGEDPAFGLEPFAYADELRAGLRLAPLLKGRLEPAALRLTGASLNFARSGAAGFNLALFLQKSLAGAGKSAAIPELSLRESRINFREGVQKSAYYLNAVDLDLEPPRAPGGELRWRYEASPARTDRAEQGFGRFSGSGRWIPGGQGGRFAVDVALERSSVSELLLLVAGRDLGLQGRFVARAFLDGPYNDLKLRGSLEMEDIERPSLLGLRAQRYQLPLQGRLDLDRQSLELTSAPPERGKPALPLEVRLEGEGLLSAPRWNASLGFASLPAAALLDFCQRLGIEPPAGLRVEGRVSGSAVFATGRPAAGEIRLPEASVVFGDAAPLRAEDGVLRLEGDLLLLEHARLLTPSGAGAELQGAWDMALRRLQFELRSSGMDIGELTRGLASLPGLETPPVLRACSAGSWRGRVGFSRSLPLADQPGPPRWTGQIALANTRCTPAGFPAPVLLEKAALELEDAGWRIAQAAGRFGNSVFRASLRHRPEDATPGELHLEASRLDGADLDRLFRAALPPQPSLLERTLRRRPAPSALQRMAVAGSIQADLLLLGRQEFRDVRSRFRWKGQEVFFEGLTGHWKGFLIQGQAEASLQSAPSRYHLRAVATGAAAGAGWLEADVGAQAASLAPGMAATVKAWAEVSSPQLTLPAGPLRQLQASVEYDGSRAEQPWRLRQVAFWLDGQLWSARGSASAQGELRLEFAAPAAPAWEGALWPPSAAPASR